MRNKSGLERNPDGSAVIPEGYRWCMECDGLTLHEKDEDRISWRATCVICGNTDIGLDCPNCGYIIEEQKEMPVVDSIQVHRSGCHNDPEYLHDGTEVLIGPWPWYDSWSEEIASKFFEDNKFPDKVVKEITKQGCHCPEYLVYKNINCFNGWEAPGSGMDCSYDWNWGCDIRCPVCGCIFDYDDGSC